MIIPLKAKTLITVFGISLLLSACSGESTELTEVESAFQFTDAQLRSSVEAALDAASDLPSGLNVQVADGIATVSGSLACEDCGGMRTPGTLNTIQQSLGAVVRAVPGISDVQFFLLVSDPASSN